MRKRRIGNRFAFGCRKKQLEMKNGGGKC